MAWDPCDECGHMLMAHKVDTKECSVCDTRKEALQTIEIAQALHATRSREHLIKALTEQFGERP